WMCCGTSIPTSSRHARLTISCGSWSLASSGADLPRSVVVASRATGRYAMYSSRLIAVLGLTVVLSAGCDKDKASNDPDSGSSLLGPMASSSSSSDSLDEGPGGELESDEELTIEPRPKLPPPEEPKEQCKMVKEGKKKVKQCGLVDPKPGLSAQHGVYTLLGDFRWGMTP